jgi:D-alanyl-D-alanine carboxypeptidase (penicillin-binding protein 5/6)
MKKSIVFFDSLIISSSRKIKNSLSVILILSMIFNIFYYYPGNIVNAATTIASNDLYALSAVLMDGDTGRVLYGKDELTPRANASTTKILTCILALEYGNTDDVVSVSSYAAKMPDVQLNINEGETYKLGDLLYSLMLESHNDTAVAIAEHVSGSVEEFADLMNKKAAEIGCNNTYFITPNGLDSEDEQGFHSTTARDLALLLRYCIKLSPEREAFLEITRTPSYSFTDSTGNRSFTCYNHNSFLNMMDGALTGKTGFTGNAGYCYVGALERNGHTFIVALLACGWPGNKTYKWSDTKKLMNYGIDNYSERIISDSSLDAENLKIVIYNEVELPLVCNFQYNILLNDEEQVSYIYNIPEELTAPVAAGSIVGNVVICIDDKVYDIIPVYAGDSIDKVEDGYGDTIKDILQRFIKICYI